MSSPQQLAPERSIFAVDPLDDFVTIVGDWIYANGRGKPNLEVSIDMCQIPSMVQQLNKLLLTPSHQIEGKIGQIIDQETGERIQLPVRNETIVDLSRTRFDSRMTIVSTSKLTNIVNLSTNRPFHTATLPPP